MIDNGYNLGVGALKDGLTLSHTIHFAMKRCTCVCIPCHQYCPCNKLWVQWTSKCPNYSCASHTKHSCWFETNGITQIFPSFQI